ncbi:hypothetical protein LCGC14_1227090 [marine sediment metagenome]|uniref:Uncharacterized protein n=1 Tax=marine sediment metagenome TaxID=412755 RepID=A0A0F9LWQ9_9ZZZZ
MMDFLPEKAALLEALKARMTPEAWERLDEVERDTIALIIRGRCTKTIEAAFAEFAELVMRASPSQKTAKS